MISIFSGYITTRDKSKKKAGLVKKRKVKKKNNNITCEEYKQLDNTKDKPPYQPNYCLTLQNLH